MPPGVSRFVGRLLVLLILMTAPFSTAARAVSASDAQLPVRARSHMVQAEPDFERLAGAIGRGEAWYRLYGGDASPATVGAEVPLTRVTPEGERRLSTTASTAPLTISPTLTHTLHLPLVTRPEPQTMVERRAIWITRYDWTRLEAAPIPEAIDAMVAQVAAAGFNTILFQVRGAGDAYYTPGLEPWSARLTTGPVSETLGLDPEWDPLARMIAAGHAAGLEVHAYVNVYTAWQSSSEDAGQGDLWPPATTPPQMFDRFTYGPTHLEHPGVYGLGYTWRQYRYAGEDTAQWMPLSWGSYLWASPGLDTVNDYIAAVIRDIVNRYDIDGVHLDRVRYAGAAYSYDPDSNLAAGEHPSEDRAQWQRDRVTALVAQVTAETKARRPDALVSAAVWPYYIDKWGWGLTEGYHAYYQDSKGWLASGSVDAIMPMLYGSVPDDMASWEILMQDFVADAAGRAVYPGIGGHYEAFSAISERIEAARAQGAPGHVIFSYGYLNGNGYWDDLAAGPYRIPATVP
ncbi:MAG: glycoside hydrolase family 10 protein [Anaerolineae bacterium]